MRHVIPIIFVVLSFSDAFAQNAQKRPAWKNHTFHGITIGKSKKSDLRRLFGILHRIFNPEDEYDNPILSMISYDYDHLAGFEGRTVFDMKKRDGIILGISLVPAEKKPLDYNWMVSQFGKGYIKS